MSLTLPEVVSLLQRRGQNQYGMEAINQLEHALQCANLAEKAGETPETIVASLLHDLGHLLVCKSTTSNKTICTNTSLCHSSEACSRMLCWSLFACMLMPNAIFA